MRDINELTSALCETFETLQRDAEYVQQAAELANISGKIINAQKIQLEYAHLKGVEPAVKFLDVSAEK